MPRHFPSTYNAKKPLRPAIKKAIVSVKKKVATGEQLLRKAVSKLNKGR